MYTEEKIKYFDFLTEDFKAKESAPELTQIYDSLRRKGITHDDAVDVIDLVILKPTRWVKFNGYYIETRHYTCVGFGRDGGSPIRFYLFIGFSTCGVDFESQWLWKQPTEVFPAAPLWKAVCQ